MCFERCFLLYACLIQVPMPCVERGGHVHNKRVDACVMVERGGHVHNKRVDACVMDAFGPQKHRCSCTQRHGAIRLHALASPGSGFKVLVVRSAVRAWGLAWVCPCLRLSVRTCDCLFVRVCMYSPTVSGAMGSRAWVRMRAHTECARMSLRAHVRACVRACILLLSNLQLCCQAMLAISPCTP